MQNCKHCGSGFSNSEEQINLYKKFEEEPPEICFDCQQKQRLTFRNERVLYNRKCDATGEDIISIYAPDSPYKVYKSEYWYGDSWDAMEYGADFNFNKTFFEQFKELQLRVPRVALINVKSENSDYCNMCIGNKNCYLVFGGDFNEDCMYCTLNMRNKDCLDIDFSNNNELTYYMDNSMNCYDCQFVWDSNNCNNCYFCSDCIGCNECVLSHNLKNKSYFINNKEYSKEEYFEKKKEILDGTYSTQQKNWSEFLNQRKNRIVKYGHILSCENCTGDYLKNSKNCHNCYEVSDSEDVRDCIFAAKTKDSFNVSLMGDDSELIYNCIAVFGTMNVKHSYFVFQGANIEYSEQMFNNQNVFGCNGLQKKNYCILNKQYSKEDFTNLRQKIVEHMKKTGEWGQFLSKDISCFGYNESTAMRYYPLTKEQALEQGFKWRDEDEKEFKSQSYNIPDNIKDIPESITQEVLACETCKKNFKIIPQELKYYKKQNIPVPHKCPDCRQMERMTLRNPPKLYGRTCEKCSTKIQTTYSPDKTATAAAGSRHGGEKIHCEKCYRETIY